MSAATRPVPEAVLQTASELSQALASADNVALALEGWAAEHGFTRASNGLSGNVWLRDDVVVKANITLDSFDHIPEPYRPEQVVVRERVKVQPRYRPLQDQFGRYTDALADFEKTFPNVREQKTFAENYRVAIDAHPGNWGLREDGSPVLFDW